MSIKLITYAAEEALMESLCLAGERIDGSMYCIIHDHVVKPVPPKAKVQTMMDDF